MGTWSFPGV